MAHIDFFAGFRFFEFSPDTEDISEARLIHITLPHLKGRIS